MAEYYDNEEMRRRRRARRREEMRKRKRRQALFRRMLPIGLIAVVAIIVIAVVAGQGRKKEKPDENITVDNPIETDKQAVSDDAIETDAKEEADDRSEPEKNDSQTKELSPLLTAKAGRTVVFLNERCFALEEERKAATKKQTFQYAAADDMLRLGEEVFSEYAILVDADNEKILAGKGEKSRIVPASMTKVLTLLVAVENLNGLNALNDEFVITTEITDYCFRNDCSVAGFAVGETVTIRDLLYGTILPSGGDGALGLAIYTAGSQEAFVELMNEKLKQLGLSDSAHFTNCMGIYNDNHYCTVYDMAIIMEAAMQDEICRNVLSTRIYTTSATEQHPEGIELSNWFLRRIEDKDTGGMTIYGKTGYVVQSGNCAVSCAVDKDGKKYICVTVNGINRWRCIEDHAYLYKRFSDG